MSSKAKAKKHGVDGPVALAVIVLSVMVAAVIVERLTRPAGDGMATLAVPMPPLRVAGWLNTGGGPGPSPETLRGQWVVIDSWATTCPPCLSSFPRLTEFYRRHRDRGVAVVGLTSEPAAFLPDIRAVLNRFDGVTWPIGYGAGLVNEQLGAYIIPNYVLFNPEGKSVWTGRSVEALEAALLERM